MKLRVWKEPVLVLQYTVPVFPVDTEENNKTSEGIDYSLTEI
jgi:hypothetical protein